MSDFRDVGASALARRPRPWEEGPALCSQPLADSELEFRRRLLLTAQVALLGEVSGAIRGVTLGWTASEIILRALVDGPVSDADQESMECVGTEIVAGFPQCSIVVEVLRCDAPMDLNAQSLKVWVHMRRER